MAARLVWLVLKIMAGIVTLMLAITITNSIFGGWWDSLMTGFRGLLVNIGGTDSAVSVAQESHDWFRRHGRHVDFLFEDIDAVALKTRELDVYRIEITEKLIGRSSLFRSIIFEQNKDVIRVEVTPYRATAGWKAQIEQLPFATYYIVAGKGENYVLMEADGHKSAARASDIAALYDQLLSYGIERIIDYSAFKKDGISCHEAASVREYSTLSGTAYYPGIFLREYQSRPLGYYMEKNHGHRHIIEAYFNYSGVNNTVPKLGDYQ